MRWAPVDDAKLLVGVLQYGLGNWENMRDDTDLGLTDKVLSQSSMSAQLYSNHRSCLVTRVKSLRHSI